ncbi:DUF2860 family protein [Vibrio sp. LaRot3]|uniref:DUF2860 family protein n=1 Tax=Vibrio sp. LaRot3 TaxID=2998829 RepID=UPI0022CDF757|nr:DUF2860 family protein [Vibrio sp. LaRot3]MDA0147578.1 DUF2860 family protein [Vibrio sp. LaRot3]
MKKLIAVSITLALSSHAMAEEVETGFGGEIGLGISYFSQDGNLNTANDTQLNNPEQTLGAEAELNPEIIGELNYTFGQQGNHQVFISTNNEETISADLAVELGYRTGFSDDSTLSVSYLTALAADETWANPYLVNQKREVTEVSSSGFRLEYDNIAGSGFGFEGLYYSEDVDSERSGEGLAVDTNLLQRSGSGFELGFEYEMQLTNDSTLTPRLNYGSFSADGDAFSNTTIGGELTYLKVMGNHALGLQGFYNNVAFDGANPLFDDKKRTDSEYGFSALYQYQGFMGWEDVSLLGLASYEVGDSDINFYDVNEYQLGAAVSYSF